MEWLTSFESLEDLLSPKVLFPSCENGNGLDYPKSILHVGCGTSCVGHRILEKYPSEYNYVLNVDIDQGFIEKMQSRQEKEMKNYTLDREHIYRCEYLHLDFDNDITCEYRWMARLPSGGFDLVVDKSTLDCMLCYESLASGLIANVFNYLKSGSGVYFIVSFHSEYFIKKLLQNETIGLQWNNIECICLDRDVEDISGIKKVSKTSQRCDMQANRNESKWSDGLFLSTPEYAKTINVFICRKSAESKRVNRAEVKLHIHEVLDDWYICRNPLMTASREKILRRSFHNMLADKGMQTTKRLSLYDAYQVLFSDAEREHLTYDFFLEDWYTFSYTEKYTMTVDEAISFLHQMQ